jgi:hypothetical protein
MTMFLHFSAAFLEKREVATELMEAYEAAERLLLNRRRTATRQHQGRLVRDQVNATKHMSLQSKQ